MEVMWGTKVDPHLFGIKKKNRGSTNVVGTISS